MKTRLSPRQYKVLWILIITNLAATVVLGILDVFLDLFG